MKQVDAFVETLEDLRHRCSLTATEYDAVQAAGLIRRLLIDRESLGLVQAKAMGSKPKARWCSLSMVAALPTAGIKAEISTLYMDPELLAQLGGQGILDSIPKILSSGSLSDFLKQPAIMAEGPDGIASVVTIHELVKHYANREGGVHYQGTVDSPLLKAAIDDLEGDLRLILITAGRIVYRAFEPILIRARFPEQIIPPELYKQPPSNVEA